MKYFLLTVVLLSSWLVRASSICDQDVPDSGVFVVESGENEKTTWAVGEACIPRKLSDAWGVLQNFELLVWDTDIIKWSARRLPAEPKSAMTFETYYKARNFPKVEWWMKWIHTVTLGSLDQPEEIDVSYEKTRGTGFIPHWIGRLKMLAITDDLTEVSMYTEIEATRQTAAKTKKNVRELFIKLVQGEPRWDDLEIVDEIEDEIEEIEK